MRREDSLAWSAGSVRKLRKNCSTSRDSVSAIVANSLDADRTDSADALVLPMASLSDPILETRVSLPCAANCALREISSNAQLAAQGNGTLVVNINSLSDAIGTTNTAAASVLTASSELTATAETLSREVETFFRNLRADTSEEARKTGT